MSQITNNIWLGAQKDALNKRFLVKNQITHVISFEVYPEVCNFDHILNIKRYHISMYDSEKEANTPEYIEKVNIASNLIDQVVQRNQHILLHCSVGKSRSPAVLVAYLMMKCNFSLEQACDLISDKRPIICIHPAFLNQISHHTNHNLFFEKRVEICKA